jgi:cell division protein FtsL
MKFESFAKILLNSIALIALVVACFVVSPYTGFAALFTIIFFPLIR